MADDDERELRADFARWFIDHDEVDEAASVLEPGDEMDLGRSAYLDLAAALGRRGLAARYDQHRVSVLAHDSGEPLASGPRKPPARAPGAASVTGHPAKRTA